MADAHHTPRGPDGKIGRVLERARKERGLTLEEAERTTKIRKRYLAGLERDDYTVLPDAVYARGFLKTYANFLGLDGDGLSRELGIRRKPHRERGHGAPGKDEFEQPIVSPGGVPGAEKRGVPRSAIAAVAVAGVVLAVLVGSLYFVGLNVRSSAVDDAGQAGRQAEGRPDSQPDRGGAARDPQDPGGVPEQTELAAGETTLGPEGTQGPEGTSPEGTSPEEFPTDRMTVGVEVEGAPAWIRIRSDSETVFEEIAQPGFSQTFEARRVVGIKAGDAGAVSVEVNGQDVGVLGDPGEVRGRKFTLKSAS